MIEIPFLADLFFVLLVGAFVAFLFSRARLPTLVGFLLTGLVLGPRATGVVSDLHSIELLAEIGVIMLLFTIGVELSLDQVVKLRRTVLLGGALQVVGTGAVAAGAAALAGMAAGPAVFVGFVVALSSTAIVLRLLTERAETTAPHGNVSVGILIFQDLAVVPMVLLVPILAGRDGGAGIVWTLVKAVLVVAVTLVVARRLVPRILRAIIATRSRELFLLATLAICLGTAWGTSQLGLSLGLGAFLAGLVISESEYGHHAFSLTVPFRDAFSTLFFVSVGMLLDVGYVVAHAGLVLGVTAAVLAVKTAVIALAVAPALRLSLRVGLLAGLFLSQIGEFSFLLLHVGARFEVVPEDVRSLWMAVTGVSMAFAPLLLRAAPGLSRWAASLAPTGGGAAAGHGPGEPPQVLLVGYGVAGRNVAHALRHVGIRYFILELNPDTVRTLQREGEPIEYGDAAQPEALVHAGVERARIVVVTIPDPATARQVVSLAHSLNPAAHVVVRTRFVAEVEPLLRLGADDVVPEEFETSLEILGRVLRTLVVPRETVDRVTREIRAQEYGLLRAWESDPPEPTPDALQPAFGEAEIEVFRVAEDSPLAGVELQDSQLRADGLLVLAVSRGADTTPNPPATFRFEPDDAVLVLGTPDQLGRAAPRFGGA